MACGEIEVALLDQEFLHSGKHLGGVTVAELGNQDADGEGLALAERAGVKAGPIVELRGRVNDPVARLLGNRPDARGIIQYERDGGWREIQILSQSSQADW